MRDRGLLQLESRLKTVRPEEFGFAAGLGKGIPGMVYVSGRISYSPVFPRRTGSL